MHPGKGAVPHGGTAANLRPDLKAIIRLHFRASRWIMCSCNKDRS